MCKLCECEARQKDRRAAGFSLFLWHEWLVWVKSYGEKDMLRLFHFNIFGLVTRAWRPFFCATRHGDPLSLPTHSPHLIKPTIAIDIVSLGFIHPTQPPTLQQYNSDHSMSRGTYTDRLQIFDIGYLPKVITLMMDGAFYRVVYITQKDSKMN